jgi:two-component system, NtrC family, sensor kinase
VAGAWRIRHKLMLGLGLVVAIMGLLLAGTVKGILSYRATMRTIGNKVDELVESDNLQVAIKSLSHPIADSLKPAREMNNRIKAAREALDKYRVKLEESVANSRNGIDGSDERERAQDIERRLDKLAQAILDVTPQVLGPGAAEGSATLIERPAVKEILTVLVGAAGDLNNVISKYLDGSIERWRKDAKTNMILVVSTTILSIILLTGLLRWFYRWVFYPIRDLNQGVDRVARGDFQYTIHVHSGDEIEDLAKAFNGMTARLREMYGELAHKVNERSRQLVRSERLAGVGFLAAGVAHEINNPLASIAFCSEGLESRLKELLTDPRAGVSVDDRGIIAKYLKMIQEEAFRCKEIIQRLLDFSRGGERRREPTELGDIIQSVIDMVQHLPNSKGKEITCETPGHLLAWVNAQEIKSVVLNLVVNALDSMDEGGQLVIAQEMHDGMAKLTFRDTGCGMAPETLENIFEPFYSRSRTGKGTGLGLSICHRIITQHGGEIEATSDGPGKGSTFAVRIPLKPPAEQREGHPEVLDPETEFGKLAGKPQRRAA